MELFPQLLLGLLPRRGVATFLVLTLVLGFFLGSTGAKRGRRWGKGGGSRNEEGNLQGVTAPPSPPSITQVLPAPGRDNVTLSTSSTMVGATPSRAKPSGFGRTSSNQQQQRQDKHKLLEAEKMSSLLPPSQGQPRSDVQIGCKELRSKRYISDGFCTSIKPVTEVVCTGHCLPMTNLPWYAEFIKVWARTKVLEWRCVNDVVKRKRVRLLCENGETRTYRIKVVKSCKCKRYMKQQNQSLAFKGRTNGSHHHRRREKEEIKKSRTNRAPS